MTSMTLLFYSLLQSASALSLNGQISTEENASCEKCLVMVTNSKTGAIQQEHFIGKHFNQSFNGQFKFSITQHGQYEVRILDLESNYQSQAQNIDVNKENNKDELKLALFKIGGTRFDADKKSFKLVNVNFGPVYNSLLIDVEKANSAIQVFLPEDRLNLKSLPIVLPVQTKKFQVRYIPENAAITSSLSVEIDLDDETKFRKIEFNEYNRCYQALVSVKHIQKPRSIIDYSSVVNGDQVTFLSAFGDIYLLRNNKVYNYGAMTRVNQIDFSEDGVSSSSTTEAPVLLYPPDGKDKTKIYYQAGSSYFLELANAPNRSGLKWRELDEAKRSAEADQLFKEAFVQRRATELRMISKEASEQLRSLNTTSASFRTEAVQSLRKVVDQCRDLGYDIELTESSDRYLLKDYIKKLNLILEQYPNTPEIEPKPGSVAAL